MATNPNTPAQKHNRAACGPAESLSFPVQPPVAGPSAPVIDPSLESDAIHWCDNGVDIVQWVQKQDGIPTGVIVWTDAMGVAIATPAASPDLIVGQCNVAAPVGAVLDPLRVELNPGDTWNPTANTRSFTIRAEKGDVMYTDRNGSVTTIYAGESLSFSIEDSSMFDPTAQVDVPAGSMAFVSYVEVGV